MLHWHKNNDAFKGQQEVYNSHEELLSQGIDTARLIGLFEDEEDDEERNIYAYKGIIGIIYNVQIIYVA